MAAPEFFLCIPTRGCKSRFRTPGRPELTQFVNSPVKNCYTCRILPGCRRLGVVTKVRLAD